MPFVKKVAVVFRIRISRNLGVADLEYDLPPKFSRGNS